MKGRSIHTPIHLDCKGLWKCFNNVGIQQILTWWMYLRRTSLIPALIEIQLHWRSEYTVCLLPLSFCAFTISGVQREQKCMHLPCARDRTWWLVLRSLHQTIIFPNGRSSLWYVIFDPFSPRSTCWKSSPPQSGLEVGGKSLLHPCFYSAAFDYAHD